MVYILLGRGFEEIEATAPGDVLRRGGVPVCYLGVGQLQVPGAHSITLCADAVLDENMFLSPEDVFVIPGGLGGVESIESSPSAMALLGRARDAGAKLAAICAGPRVLAGIGVLQGKKITCYPGCEAWMTGASVDSSLRVCFDGLLTGRGPGTAVDFGLALLQWLRGEEAARTVRADLTYDG